MNQYGHSNYGYGGITIDDRPSVGAYDPHRHFKVAQNAGFDAENEGQTRILYIGNLDPNVTEDFLFAIFSQVGQVTKIKAVKDILNSESYAFVEFLDPHIATLTLQIMNKRFLLQREMQISWVTAPPAPHKVDKNHSFSIFVGDLSADVDNVKLKEAFSEFGDIIEAKVLYDPQTMRSKGYGFVSFATREQAATAIASMNGKYLGKRPIRTNWASRNP